MRMKKPKYFKEIRKKEATLFFKDIPLFRTLFPSQGEVNYIKRVVGLPGDEIDIRDGYLYINGEKQFPE